MTHYIGVDASLAIRRRPASTQTADTRDIHYWQGDGVSIRLVLPRDTVASFHASTSGGQS